MSSSRLVHRLHPRSLSDVVGQTHLLDEGRPLGDALRADRPHSFVAWGPPGTGKSVVVDLAAQRARGPVASLRGETCRIEDVGRALDEGAGVLCIEALHRLSPESQDALLPALDGTVLVFATSSSEPETLLNPALRSRLAAYRFRPLSTGALEHLLERALEGGPVGLAPAAREFLVAYAAGDGRVLLDGLERVLASRGAGEATLDDAVRCVMPERADHAVAGTGHFDVVTAFVKSLRGSDPDAGLYWLASMLEAGEEPAFIAHRMLGVAAEDVGMADPLALVVAQSVADIVAHLAVEAAGRYLAHAAVYLASAPKSNAVARGLEKAGDDVRSRGAQPVPLHLRPRTMSGAPDLGYSQGSSGALPRGQLLFPQYLPDTLTRERFYEPTESGAEARMRERLRAWWPDRF